MTFMTKSFQLVNDLVDYFTSYNDLVWLVILTSEGSHTKSF